MYNITMNILIKVLLGFITIITALKNKFHFSTHCATSHSENPTYSSIKFPDPNCPIILPNKPLIYNPWPCSITTLRHFPECQSKQALTRDLPSAQNLLFLQPVLEPCQASLQTNKTCCLARKDKAQLGHIVVNETARLVHIRKKFHLLQQKHLY